VDITINREVIVQLLDTVRGVVSRKSVLDETKLVKLSAMNGKLSATATNMSLTVNKSTDCTVKTDGDTLVPPDLLRELVASLKDEALRLHTDDKGHLLVGKGLAKIKCMNAEPFPLIDVVSLIHAKGNTAEVGAIHSESLAEAIRRGGFQAVPATDDGFKKESGIRLLINGVKSLISSYDGYSSIAMSKIDGVDSSRIVDCVIPSNNLRKLIDYCTLVDAVEVYADGEESNIRRVYFLFGNVLVVSQVMNDNIPDYGKFSKGFESSSVVQVRRDEMSDALKQVSLFASEQYASNVTISMGESSITLKVRDANTGDIDAEVPAQISGTGAYLVFNPKSLKRVIDQAGEVVEMRINGSELPVLIKTQGQDGWLCVVAPRTISK
jgi:DNA polymerase III sliding clamp (beta) subunit (PCNA family)